MAAASNPYDRMRKVLECSICLDVYEDPKTLRCAHEYCKNCLEDILVFQKDGTITITCPMRCEQKTLLQSDETVRDLATAYTINSMLDALRLDDASMQKGNHPSCKRENCVRPSAVFCSGSTICRECYSQHNVDVGGEKEHSARSLVYNTRENTLRVLCDEHCTGCTHVCSIDDQLLCLYCLHRDKHHRNHAKNTVETEARLLKEALQEEIEHFQNLGTSAEERALLVEESKDRLEVILQQRKDQCLARYKILLEQEMIRLTDEFDGIASRYGQTWTSVEDTVDFSKRMAEKHDIEIVLQKKEILQRVGQPASALCRSVELSLSEIDFVSKEPLGRFLTTFDKKAKGGFKCTWMQENDIEISSIVPSETVLGEEDTGVSDLDVNVVCESDTQVQSEEVAAVLSVTDLTVSAASASLITMPDPDQDHCGNASVAAPCDECNPESSRAAQEFDVNVKVKPLKPGKELRVGACAKEQIKEELSALLNSKIQDYTSKCISKVRSTFAGGTENKSPEHGNCQLMLPGLSDDASVEDYAMEGYGYFELDDYERSIELYSKAIKLCPRENSDFLADLHLSRARAYEQLNKWSAMVEDCSASIRLDPKSCPALYGRARAYEKLDQKRKAVEDWVFLKEIFKDLVVIVSPFSREDIEQFLNNALQSLSKELAEQLTRRRPMVLPPPYTVKDYFFSFNYDVFAISATNEVDKNYSDIMRNMKKGKYGNVMKLCDQEIEQRGVHKSRALLLRGTIKEIAGDPSSIDDFVEVSGSPLNETTVLIHIDAQLKIARWRFTEGDLQRCFSAVQFAYGLDDKNASVHATKGEFLMKLQRTEEAKKSFQTAISLDSSFICPRLFLFAISKATKNAEGMLFQLTRDFPCCPQVWRTYATFLFQRGKIKEAMEKLDMAISTDASSPVIILNKAKKLMELDNNVEEVKQLLLRAIKIDKRSPDAYIKLGSIAMLERRWDLAVKDFEKAIQMISFNQMESVFRLLETAKAMCKYEKCFGVSN